MKLAFSETTTRIPLPAGTYKVTVEKAFESTTKNGNPCIDLWLQADGQLPATLFKTTVYNTTGAQGRMIRALLSCGYQIGADIEPTASSFLQRRALVKVGQNDRGYTDVLDWLPRPSTASNKISHDDLAGQQAPSALDRIAATKIVDIDDIPFA